ncbi:hypothetical protein VRRI112168_08115 [Vreelandella rituensis]|uniref:Uncharacterized protein n=1 Tax=Vreelandella rituensis TaxID=2282306 RepID=A0A368TXG8_9GAMM|nr:hypothetical protein [Halomonas rituensis]RCV89046.1 hypothetical protein DU506_13540 [Halomonas rituensis]
MRIFHGHWRFPLLCTLFLSFQVQAQETAEEVDLGVDQAEAFDLLGEAVEYFDELKTLPESHWLKRDQESAEGDINALIEDAIEVLDVPGLAELRERYRAVEDNIQQEKRAIAELRERRILAPDMEAGVLTQYTPTETLKSFTAETRGDFDLLIEVHEANLAAFQYELEQMRQTMSAALAKLDVDMPPDQLELWLSSAIGEDVVSMGVVFDSIRRLTLRLEALTQESGENLDFAKRYYGMLVILHKLVVHMQEGFITKVNEEVLPKLQGFRDEADALIAESRRLIGEGNNRAALQQNIDANELTKRAIVLYERIVESQRHKVNQALEVSRREEAVAANTYRTVALSASVTTLIRDGINTFETLSNLQVPDAAEFQNAEIREEFRKLTARLEASD